MIDDNFLEQSQEFMVETQDGNRTLQPHQVQILNGCEKSYEKTLYRFDLNKQDFLPFFNHTDEAPEGLKQFCDYILLIENDYTYIVLIEMKRGIRSQSDAKKQLNASEVFIQYIINSAERLRADFAIGNFNPNRVKIIKILLLKNKSDKKITRHHAERSNIQDYIIYKSVNTLNINRILHSIDYDR